MSRAEDLIQSAGGAVAMVEAVSSPSSVSRELEKFWGNMDLVGRLDLIRGLGVDEKLLKGKSLSQVIQITQDNLPVSVRGRLILALTSEGFSLEEYKRVIGTSK